MGGESTGSDFSLEYHRRQTCTYEWSSTVFLFCTVLWSVMTILTGTSFLFLNPNQMFHQVSAVRPQSSPSVRRQALLRVSPSVGPSPSALVRLTSGRNEFYTLSCPCRTQVMGVWSAAGPSGGHIPIKTNGISPVLQGHLY